MNRWAIENRLAELAGAIYPRDIDSIAEAERTLARVRARLTAIMPVKELSKA